MVKYHYLQFRKNEGSYLEILIPAKLTHNLAIHPKL